MHQNIYQESISKNYSGYDKNGKITKNLVILTIMLYSHQFNLSVNLNNAFQFILIKIYEILATASLLYLVGRPQWTFCTNKFCILWVILFSSHLFQ